MLGAVPQVIAVGPGAKDKDGKLMAMSVSIGETVLLPEYGASMIKLGDEEFHLIKDMDILGKLEGYAKARGLEATSLLDMIVREALED